MYIPRISTPLDIHGISMDIRVYPMDIDQDGIYNIIHGIYMEYSMYILEIGVPDDGWKTMAGTFWHTSDILSTILIHVGAPRVHVCNALGGYWSMSWHTPDILSILLIHVGVPCKRV